MGEKNYYIRVGNMRVGVTKEVYAEYKRSSDKERYFMERLKKGRVRPGADGKTVYVPGCETSYEQLLEAGWDIPVNAEAVEDAAVRAQLLERLAEALRSLSDEELALIHDLFYAEKSEREAGAERHISQAAVNKRKRKALEKLKKIFAESGYRAVFSDPYII